MTWLCRSVKSTAFDSIKPGVNRMVIATNIDHLVLREHTESFNPAVSHYWRQHAPERRHLPSDVTIKTMHADFNSRHHSHTMYSRKQYTTWKFHLWNMDKKNVMNVKNSIYAIHRIPSQTAVLFVKSGWHTWEELVKQENIIEETQRWTAAPVSALCLQQTCRSEWVSE